MSGMGELHLEIYAEVSEVQYNYIRVWLIFVMFFLLLLKNYCSMYYVLLNTCHLHFICDLKSKNQPYGTGNF